MKYSGMCGPRVRSPKQDYVCLFHLAIGTRAAPRSENRRQTGDARGVSSPVAAIDVVRSHHGTNKFLGGVVQLVGGLGATEHTEASRIMLLDRRTESLGHALQSFLPCGGNVANAFSAQRLGEESVA